MLRFSGARRQAGDTLIEVLFAITIFALIVVSALALMNQGTASAQRSLEMTLVRQEMDNQAETLRFLHEAYVTNYQTGYESNPNLTLTGPTGEFYKIIQAVKAAGIVSATPIEGISVCPTPPNGSFVLNTRTGAVITNQTIFTTPATYAQLVFDTITPNSLTASAGLWIEAVRSVPNTTDPAQAKTGYIDFHIRACWDTVGASQPKSMGTIVRLYEPRA